VHFGKHTEQQWAGGFSVNFLPFHHPNGFAFTILSPAFVQPNDPFLSFFRIAGIFRIAVVILALPLPWRGRFRFPVGCRRRCVVPSIFAFLPPFVRAGGSLRLGFVVVVTGRFGLLVGRGAGGGFSISFDCFGRLAVLRHRCLGCFCFDNGGRCWCG
jgi:hypothetical protein